jgi:Fic family protein
MKTLKSFARAMPQIPTATVWLLNDLAEYRGKQDLFTKQSPQKLEKLREHAIIESAVSSNRIEGVEIDCRRVGAVILGKELLQDRNEEEVRGYQTALAWIHDNSPKISVSSATIRKLHALTKPGLWDSGEFKEDDGEIVEKHADGRVTIRFKPTPAAETPDAVKHICDLSGRLLREKEVPPLIVWAALNLDLLCIHPFRDGNGRVSRLLLLLSLYHLGFEAGRYISLERIIEQSKERYYETLRQSSQGWHERRHDPWPYVNYLLYALKELYAEFEQRVGSAGVVRGEKTSMILRAIDRFPGEFTVADIRIACPGVGVDLIRKVLGRLKGDQVECLGRGQSARWRRLK